MKTITDKICTIQRLAIEISQANIAHVFCRYSGHIDAFDVDVYPADTSYQSDDGREKIIDELIRLNRDGQALHRQLDHLIADLIALKQGAAA